MKDFLLVIPVLFFAIPIVLALVKIKSKSPCEMISLKSRLERKFLKYINNIDSLLKPIDKSIEKIKLEVNLIPENQDFLPIKEAKVKILEELKISKELIVQKVVSKIKEEFPIILVVNATHIKEVKKNKDVMEMYRNYIQNKYNKKFKLLSNSEFNSAMRMFERRIESDLNEELLLKLFKEVFVVIFEKEELSHGIFDTLYKEEYIQTKGTS